MTESRLPPLAIILAAAGLVPFVICALSSVRDDPTAAAGPLGILALISYGAIVLSFLGGVHWGFVMEGGKEPAERARLSLGVVPALLGWGAALLGLAAHAILGLAVLIAGYIATVIVEGRGRREHLVPRAYLIMRWGLTIVVVALLTTVLVLRLTGASIDV